MTQAAAKCEAAHFSVGQPNSTHVLTRVSFHSPVCVLIIDDEQDLGLAYDRFRWLTAS